MQMQMGAKTALYLLASGLDDESEDKKIAVLLHCIGEDALEIYNTLDIPKKMEEVIKAFENDCAPCRNTVFEKQVLGTSV